jgi:hypothetical protein
METYLDFNQKYKNYLKENELIHKTLIFSLIHIN